MRYAFLIVVFVGLLFSCRKKDHPKPQFFIGTWDWEYTLAYHYDGSGQVYKVDTIYPKSDMWGVDFDCHFTVKNNGSIRFFRNDSELMKIRAKDLYYGYDEVRKRASFDYNKGDKFTDAGEYTRLNLRGYLNEENIVCHGFPIDGGAVANQLSIIHKNSKVVVYNIFIRR